MENIKYLSGWEALNIPNERGLTADWHSSLLHNKPLKFYETKDCPIWQEKGISLRFVPSLQETYYVASFARAIADLVYNGKFAGLQNCAYDFLDEQDEEELFAYLTQLREKKEIDNFMKYELTKLYFKDKNVGKISSRLKQCQKDRIALLKEILLLFADKFILKGEMALSLYYGLNRYVEDLEFDCKSENMNFINTLKRHKNFTKWRITIKKDTDCVFRAMIDYGAESHLGAYLLTIEISSYNKFFLQNHLSKYSNKQGVNVYDIDELIKMKVVAFSGRDKIRDFYDLGFLLQMYPQHFSKESLFAVYEKISYAGVDELNLLLLDEINTHNLILLENIDIDNYAQNMLKNIERVIENM